MVNRRKHWAVHQFGPNAKPAKYSNTWFWDVGYSSQLIRGFPLFHIEKQSHGYRKGTKWQSRKGPIIKSKAAAIRQAKAAMAKLK